ncbi:hypothetical protein RQP46_009033 [Phenoliferia psychrophenolica]
MADWEIKLGSANPDSDIKPAIPDAAVPIPVPVQQPSPQPRSPSADSSIEVFTPELPDEHPSGVPYKNIPWTKAEDTKLLQLFEDRKELRPRQNVWTEIAPLLGRTSGGCSSRWYALQATQTQATTPSGNNLKRGKKTPTPANKAQSDTQKKRNNNNNNSDDDDDDDERDARHKHRRRSPPSPVAGPSGSIKSSTGKTPLSHELVFIKAASDRLQDQIARMGTATGADAWRLKAEVEETRTTLGNALKAFDPGQ